MPGNHPRPVNAQWAPQRLSILLVGFLLLLALLFLRLLLLGVLRGEHFAELSLRNYIFTRKFDAPRGTIHDRNGKTLAFNRATFAVSMSPGNLTSETILTSLHALETMLEDQYTTRHFQSVLRLRPRWKSEPIARRLTLNQATAVLEHRYNLPGVLLEPKFQRYYPYGDSLCHVLGHVGKIDRKRWDRKDQLYQGLGYELDDEIGVMGIEAAFEDTLRGEKGLEQVHQSGRGRILRSNTRWPAVPGKQVFLTIDLELQQLAESLLLGRRGVILACDPRNGEMLVWASAPTFDLNNPMQFDDPSSKPQINRAIQEYYQPGSTFKVMTALAGLEAQWPPERIVYCDLRYYLPNWRQPFRCLAYHENLDLSGAIKHSCNVYFYTIANHIYTRREPGMDLVNLAGHYGFSELTQLGMAEAGAGWKAFGEKSGSLPTAVQLQQQRGSMLHLAIGQGLIEVTPLQMLMAYAALANGHDLLVPLLVREVRGEDGMTVFASQKTVKRATGVNPEHRRLILEGMARVCNERRGTAWSAGFDPAWRVAGKTSTAERGRDAPADAWFIGIAPHDDPELVLLILLEHGGSGGRVAAPLAVKMFERYFSGRPAAPTTVASR